MRVSCSVFQWQYTLMGKTMMFSTCFNGEIAPTYSEKPISGHPLRGHQVITKKERSEGLQYKRRFFCMRNLDAPGESCKLFSPTKLR